MAGWDADVDRMLYDGETVDAKIPVGAGGVVVTSHRVLAITPDSDGANFSQADRPNVERAARETEGRISVLLYGIQAGFLGVLLLVAGQVINFDGIGRGIDLGAAGRLGLGQLVGLMNALFGFLAALDELLTVGGLLAVAAGLGLTGAWLVTREEQVVLTVAGGADLTLPAPEDLPDETVDRIDRAVA